MKLPQASATIPICALLGLALLQATRVAVARVDPGWAAHQPGVVFYVQTTRPVVALTFDDGPNAGDTPAVLRALQAAGVHATFFVLGAEAERHPDLLRKIVAEGSEVGVHSFNHPNMARLGAAEISDQIRRSAAVIERITGQRPRLFRFPYFSHTPAGVQAVRAMGFTVIEASVDPKDWSHPGVEAIVRRSTEDLRPGDILLFHDGGGQSQTVAALPEILRRLRAAGIEPVTVSQLLALGPPSYEVPGRPTAPPAQDGRPAKPQ